MLSIGGEGCPHSGEPLPLKEEGTEGWEGRVSVEGELYEV